MQLIEVKKIKEIAVLLDSMLRLERDKGGSAITPFRPEFKDIFGTYAAALLVERARYWFTEKNYQPFYKFNAPCGHALYRPGDSWGEELCMSRHELDNALDKVAKKVTSGDSKLNAYKTSVLIYWTDSDRVTWYDMNLLLLAEKMRDVYRVPSIMMETYLRRLDELVTDANGQNAQ